jgi:hypothetical protein
MDTVLAYLSNAFVAGAIGLTLGIVFGQKIKDFVTGVPADVRATSEALITKVKADLNTARLDVLAKFVPAATKPAVPPAPAIIQVPVPTATPPAAPAA